MVDFEKLMNRTPEEKAEAEKEIEMMRQELLESIKDDPSVRKMNRLLREDKK